MEIEMLFAKRVGDTTPELLVAWDEVSIDANEQGWVEAQATAKESLEDDLERWIIVRVDLPQEQIEAALNPALTFRTVLPTHE